jgi:hypothetical protein
MPISDKLDEAIALAKTPPARPCAVTRLLDSDQLEVSDSKKLRDVIDAPVGTPGRLKNTDIVAILRSEGIALHITAMDRHRAKTCSCAAVQPGQEGK